MKTLINVLMYLSLDFDVFQFNMMSEERPELSGK